MVARVRRENPAQDAGDRDSRPQRVLAGTIGFRRARDISSTRLRSDVVVRLFEFLRRLVRGGEADPLAELGAADTRVIVGLGNPGPEYAATRHNLGFRCVEELARRYPTSWQDRARDLHALVAIVRVDDHVPLVLVEPRTFMNRSGEALKAVRDRLGIAPRQCLVVYDDMDLPLGALRVRERGGPGTHNGMRSVAASLGTEAIPRLRIGIGQAAPGEATSHVLSEFGPDERPAVDALVARSADAALTWAINGAAVAMNRYNNS